MQELAPSWFLFSDLFRYLCCAFETNITIFDCMSECLIDFDRKVGILCHRDLQGTVAAAVGLW